MINLIKKPQQPQKKYLVFTSAGINSNLMHWLKGERNFDLWVSYYGDEDNKFKDNADYYIAKKGGKFPNFHYCYQKWNEIISHYDAVMIMDDDLIFSGSDISQLFNTQQELDLWLLQPAFDRRGKVSFSITETHAFSKLRYVNFVEVTCPLFQKGKLAEFMAIYDPILIGWGVDLWYSEILSKQDTMHNKIAIIDEISCINPRDKTKQNQLREIDKLQNTETRQLVWQTIQEKHNLDRKFKDKKQNYTQINAKPTLSNILLGIKIKLIKLAYNCYKNIRSEKWRPS
ncbi:hypothetical protein [Paraglaciecola sp. L3A3]|uniref:hypothetical protein n=1 Tax=Paraglaciecola sp. L3A3 TaxID=2686358 RepID=UPI00131AEA31|nr:hypothetical protein [Paraglaciecola sp. L3A3]